MKKLFTLMSPNNEESASHFGTSQMLSQESQMQSKFSPMKSHMTSRGNISSRGGMHTNDTTEYQKLLQTDRPKWTQGGAVPNAIDEKQSIKKLVQVNHKLQEEEGFSKTDVDTVNQNMIFFKSVAEVKKRNQELRDRIRPQNVKNTQSKISNHLKGVNSQFSSPGYQSTQRSSNQFNNLSANKRSSNLRVSQGKSSQYYGSPSKMETEVHQDEIEHIINQQNYQTTDINPLLQDTDGFERAQSQDVSEVIIDDRIRPSDSPSMFDRDQDQLDQTHNINGNQRDNDNKQNFEDSNQVHNQQNNQQLLSNQEDARKQFLANDSYNNRLLQPSHSQRLSNQNSLSPQRAGILSINESIQCGKGDKDKKPHHQEVTEAFLSKFRQDPEQLQQQERMMSPGRSNGGSPVKSGDKNANKNWREGLLRPVKETKKQNTQLSQYLSPRRDTNRDNGNLNSQNKKDKGEQNQIIIEQIQDNNDGSSIQNQNRDDQINQIDQVNTNEVSFSDQQFESQDNREQNLMNTNDLVNQDTPQSNQTNINSKKSLHKKTPSQISQLSNKSKNFSSVLKSKEQQKLESQNRVLNAKNKSQAQLQDLKNKQTLPNEEQMKSVLAQSQAQLSELLKEMKQEMSHQNSCSHQQLDNQSINSGEESKSSCLTCKINKQRSPIRKQ